MWCRDNRHSEHKVWVCFEELCDNRELLGQNEGLLRPRTPRETAVAKATRDPTRDRTPRSEQQATDASRALDLVEDTKDGGVLPKGLVAAKLLPMVASVTSHLFFVCEEHGLGPNSMASRAMDAT